MVSDITWDDYDLVMNETDLLHTKPTFDGISPTLEEGCGTCTLRWEANEAMEEDENFRIMQEEIIEEPAYVYYALLPSNSRTQHHFLHSDTTLSQGQTSTAAGTVSPEPSPALQSSWDFSTMSLRSTFEENLENLAQSMRQSEATRNMLLCWERNQREYLLHVGQREDGASVETELQNPTFRLFDVDSSRRSLLNFIGQEGELCSEQSASSPLICNQGRSAFSEFGTKRRVSYSPIEVAIE